MAEIEVKAENVELVDKLRNKYSMYAKLLFLIAIILFIWVIIVFLGASVLDYGYNWAGLSLEAWIITVSVIILIFIAIDFLFLSRFSSVKNKIMELGKPKIEFVDGKRVHVITHPKGMEGGIFSKTYVEIDEHNVLRLRTLMIPPEELWGKIE
jgi:hypothetical protein